MEIFSIAVSGCLLTMREPRSHSRAERTKHPGQARGALVEVEKAVSGLASPPSAIWIIADPPAKTGAGGAPSAIIRFVTTEAE